MKRVFLVGLVMSLSAFTSVESAQAGRRVREDALLGGVAGMALGGIVGGGAGGMVAGGLIGGATGALIGHEAERRQNGFYRWRGGCYADRGGRYEHMHPRYCD